MILACHNLKKSFGDRIIVDTGSFHIEEREKAALVGVNGAGKSTIFKMIIGEEPSDGGEIILAKGRSIGYLAQHQNLIPNGTIYEELRSATGIKRTVLHSVGLRNVTAVCVVTIPYLLSFVNELKWRIKYAILDKIDILL